MRRPTETSKVGDRRGMCPVEAYCTHNLYSSIFATLVVDKSTDNHRIAMLMVVLVPIVCCRVFGGAVLFAYKWAPTSFK